MQRRTAVLFVDEELKMIPIRVVAIPTEIAEAVRRTGRDRTTGTRRTRKLPAKARRAGIA